MGKRKSGSKRSVKKNSAARVLNSLEIAERELNGEDERQTARRGRGGQPRGAVVNLLKRAEARSAGADVSDEDEVSNSFEDEELVSDEALGSDDDIDVLSSNFSQTIRDRRKDGNTSDNNEEDANYTSIDEDDLLPLSAVWDMDTKEEDEPSKNERKLAATQQPLVLRDDNDDEEEASSSSSSGEDDSTTSSEAESEDPFDEISDNEEDVELTTITSKLISDTSKGTKKGLNNYGGGEENEFDLPSVTSSKSASKLNLDDMMSVVDDKKAVAMASLINPNNNSTLQVPLPQRIQKRHERLAAYEISKKEVDKWHDTVQQNRRAEHLTFPLNPAPEHNHTSAFTRESGKQQTELEEKIDAILQDSNLVDPQKNNKFEDLDTAKLSPEEMKKRTAETRLMRELMFREERKARRIKKIKSKAYHRIKKKELLKAKRLAGLDDESDEEHDIARARERMSLKHNTNSKWAKDMLRHGMANDQETREEVEEMLRQRDILKSKIMDYKTDDESDAKLSDIEQEYETTPASASREENLKGSLGKSGVMNMAFMKNAEAREKSANIEALKSLRAMERDDAEEDLDATETTESKDTQTGRFLNQGRRVYTPTADNKLTTKTESEETTSQGLTIKMGENIEKEESKSANKPVEEMAVHSNPWLPTDEESVVIKKSSKVNVLEKDTSKSSKSKNKIEKDKAKAEARRLQANKANTTEEPLIDIDNSSKLGIVDPYHGSDTETGGFMFKQQDAIAEAFAGDDLMDEFEQEKKRVADDEDDKEEDVTLPGWGEWSGVGDDDKGRKKKRKFIKKVKGVVEKDKRKDKNLQNVIINEKMNKKNRKYQSSAVPFPFENREQYERSLRLPLGQEWTSKVSHQRLIKPRISTKPGQVIDPLKLPFK